MWRFTFLLKEVEYQHEYNKEYLHITIREGGLHKIEEILPNGGLREYQVELTRHECISCQRSLKYRQFRSPHGKKMCEECYWQHVPTCDGCRAAELALLVEEKESHLQEIAALEQKMQVYSSPDGRHVRQG